MADKNMWPLPASHLFQKVPLLNAKFSFRSVMAHWKMLSPSLIKTPQQSSPEMGIQCRVALACMQWSCQSKVWNFLSNLFGSLKWLYGDYHYSAPEELTIEDVSLCLWCHSVNSPATFWRSVQLPLIHTTCWHGIGAWDLMHTVEMFWLPRKPPKSHYSLALPFFYSNKNISRSFLTARNLFRIHPLLSSLTLLWRSKSSQTAVKWEKKPLPELKMHILMS